MSAREYHRHQHGRGFGYAVGLGIAAALLIGVIAIGHAIFGQLKGAALVVLVFAEAAACVILGAVTLAALGLLAYVGQHGRLKLAERRLGLEQLARQVHAVHAEVIDGRGAEALESAEREALESARPTLKMPAILGRRPRTVPGRHLEAVPEPPERDGFRRTFLGYVPEPGDRDGA